MRVHLDTDFLVYALGRSGAERRRLLSLAESDAVIEMSAVAWYELARGPRTPEQLAVARSFFADDGGIVALSEELALRAAEVFRSLGSPRKRAADIAIGVTASASGALLLSRNRRDFAGIPGLTLEAVAD
ncbi:MAG: type II toxin-antitoxin system VapC family toxin [Myxococcales bacterium]|nr:type II toxin-antitoxin system VapC family toxin [Myxococcales bacterium]